MEIHELTAEEETELKRQHLERFKSDPNWKTNLATCHLKCSEPHAEAVWLWMWLSEEEQAELYREAGLEPL